jgi:hypothetical protein
MGYLAKQSLIAVGLGAAAVLIFKEYGYLAVVVSGVLTAWLLVARPVVFGHRL